MTRHVWCNCSAARGRRRWSHPVRCLLWGAICCLLMFIVVSRVPYSTPTQWVFALIVGGERTQYAEGYSEWAWMRVRTEMPESELVRLMGRPPWFDQLSKRDVCWKYSRRAEPDDRFHIRWVIIRDHVVVEKISKFSEWP